MSSIDPSFMSHAELLAFVLNLSGGAVGKCIILFSYQSYWDIHGKKLYKSIDFLQLFEISIILS